MRNLSFIFRILVLSVLLWSSKAVAADKSYSLADPWVFTITHQVTVSNPTSNTIRDVTVSVPLMDTHQPVYQELLAEQFSPWPDKIVSQSSSGRTGIYRIPMLKPGQTLVLKQIYAIKNYSIKFNIDGYQVSSDYQGYQGINRRYLLPETRIESDHPSIIKYARDVVKGETNPYFMAEKLFADINLFMTYKNGPNANKGALNAIRTGEGTCEDYTDLFVASARSLGIPARWKTGYLYLPKEYNSFPYIKEDGNLDITLMRHTWPEFYLPKIGWVVLDPTFTYLIDSGKKQQKVVDWSKFAGIESGFRHIFFNYGNHDGGHIECNSIQPVVEFSEFMEFGKNIFPYLDAIDHWAKDSILFLNDFTPQIIGGYGNGLFGPNDFVTRAQVAAMLNRSLSLSYNVDKLRFPDVSPGYWAYADIAAAKGAGLVAGYPDGTFRPERYVTRAEMAAILNRAFNLPYPAAGLTFKDLGQPGFAWADASIITLAGNGIAGGYQGGLFRPERSVTRAEFAVFLSRILNQAFRLPIR